MKKITALFCIAILVFAMCICIYAADGLTFNDRNFMYAVDGDLSGEPVTVEAKILIPSGVKRGTIFGNYHWDESSNNIDFGIGKSGNPVIRVRNDDKVYQYIFPDKTVPYNTWVHIAFVRDVKNKMAYCYVDGTLAATVDMADSYDALATWDYKIGGNNVFLNSEYFKGTLASLAVYSDVRSASEIRKDAAGTIDKSSLMLYYDFSNASNRPATIADKSGNGNNATLNRVLFDGGEISASDYAYTFAVVGDTQNMAKSYPEHFNDIYNYIYDNRDEMNIEAVLGLGDITDTKNGGSVKSEWKVALKGHKIIDDVTLNIPIIGDHDNPYWYNRTISKLNYADMVVKYQSHDLRNGYVATEIGGVPYLFMQFQKGPDNDILAWANEVVSAHPNHNVIITTHAYLNHDGTTLDVGDSHLGGMTNYGEAMWEKFVSLHNNIVLVISGHIGYDYAVVNQRKGVNGNIVTEMLLDFQSSDNQADNIGLSEYGLGIVNLFHFSKDGKTLTVETYSTVLGKHFMDLNQLTLELDTVGNKTYVKPVRDPLPPREEGGEIEEPSDSGKPEIIYQNDFSDAKTLSDFTQYRAKWEIKNGHLYMTDTPTSEATSVSADSFYGHIIYNGGKDLENYVIDFDFYNVCTQSGVVFRAFDEALSHKQNGFNGYIAFMSTDMTKGAIGAAVNDKWKNTLDVGVAGASALYGANLHINVVVNEDIVKVKITNIDNEKIVYRGAYMLGSNLTSDPNYVKGSFGFRMRAKNGDYIAAGKSYFDNLVVTSIPEKSMDNLPPIDISGAEVVYENNFDNAKALNDFSQYYGTWTVKDGHLYLAEVTSSAALLVYNGEDFKELTDYVVDVDMYNTQSQGGVILRSAIDRITATSGGENFYGYTAFVSKNGKKTALGYGLSDGTWGSNIKVSDDIITPGANVHIQAAVKGDVITYKLTSIDTGALLWEHTNWLGLWDVGTFGFRLSRDTNDSGIGNVDTVYFDNLVVRTIPHVCSFSEWEIRKLATYQADGEYSRYCTECAAEETKPIPKLVRVNADITVDSTSALAGENAVVSVNVKNNGGFENLSFAVEFDTSILKLTKIDISGAPAGLTASSVADANKNGKILFEFTSSEVYGSDFAAAELTFETKFAVADKTSSLTVTGATASYMHYQGTREALDLGITNGSVLVIGQKPPFGDIDTDGKVNFSDVKVVLDTILDGSYSESVDFNGDGKISLIDIVIVIREAIK
nr:hypothetical protein [Clostridia bacterium]